MFPMTYLFSGLSTATIPLGEDRVRTSGRTIVGEYVADYVYDSSQGAMSAWGTAIASENFNTATVQAAIVALESRFRVKTANNRWFILDFDQTVFPGHFGAIGNDSADDRAALQDFIDWHIYFLKRQEMRLDSRTFLCGGPLHLGYGDTFLTATLIGEGRRFANSHRLGGTGLRFIDATQMGVNIQGGRGSGIRNLSIFGPLTRLQKVPQQTPAHPLNGTTVLAGMGHLNHRPQIDNVFYDDLDVANWKDPDDPATGYRRYSPNAGISIDAYSGPAKAIGAWAASTYYSVGTIVSNDGGKAYECVVAGTSAASGGPSGTATPIQDGSVTWRHVGDAASTQYAYPVPDYPNWLAPTRRTGFGKAPSSAIPIHNVQVQGFHVGVVTHPNGSDGNGDFLRLVECVVQDVAYGLSVSHTQSRDVILTGTMFNHFHTAITTSKHGAQNGRLNGVWTAVEISGGINGFDLGNGAALWGPLVLDNCYGESLFRLGHIGNAGAGTAAIVFNGGLFSHGLVGTFDRGVPLYMIGSQQAAGFGPSIPVLMRGTNGANFPRTYPMLSNVVQMDGCQTISAMSTSLKGFLPAWEASTPEEPKLYGIGEIVSNDGKAYWCTTGGTSAASGGPTGTGTSIVDNEVRWRSIGVASEVEMALKLLQNTLAGGVILPSWGKQGRTQGLRYVAKSLSGGADALVDTCDMLRTGTGRDQTISVYTKSVQPPGADQAREHVCPHRKPTLDKSSTSRFANSALTDGVWTWTNTQTEAACEQEGSHVGGLIYDNASGLCFLITSRTGAPGSYSFTAVLLNGYRRYGSEWTYEQPFNETAGVVVMLPGRLYGLSYPTTGDVTSGSATISAVGTDDGVNAYVPLEIAPGDWMAVDNRADFWVVGGNRKVSAVTAGTITLAGNASKTQADKPIQFLRRAPIG
jgi:hypothetical protein